LASTKYDGNVNPLRYLRRSPDAIGLPGGSRSGWRWIALSRIELNRLIDHTILKPEATPEDVARVCGEALEYDFFSVCVNTHFVRQVAASLAGTHIKVCSISGFPLGAVETSVKAYEAAKAVAQGAHEIDMVMNIGALKAGDEKLVRDDIAAVAGACGEAGLKVIIEAALLTGEEKLRACILAKEAGAFFVKTSTGFGPPGADPNDVRIMRKAVGPDFGVKASAGIRTAAFALELVEAGATRIGTSAGVKIMQEWKKP
jgi:deoxyribose-phosphate aldolase